MKPEEMRRHLGELPEGDFLIGVSGGADSVAMLMLLTGCRNRTGRMEAVHVNHGLRGEESDGDEAYVRQICAEQGIPLHVYRVDLHGKTDENSAREARFACFRECAEKTGIRVLLLAHHMDDAAETLLMRLMRGSGTEGLACMEERYDYNGFTIYRPMLSFRRNEIRDMLREEGISWREDSSNQNSGYFRNDVRQRLLPLMEEMAGGTTERLVRTAKILSEENRMLEARAKALLETVADGLLLDTRGLMEETDSIRRRVVRQWWQAEGPRQKEHTLSFDQSRALAALIDMPKGKVNLPGGIVAVRGKQMIHLIVNREKDWTEVRFSGEMVRIGGIMLSCGPGEGSPGNGKDVQEVPAEWLNSQELTVRTRRPGDRILPFGMSKSRKLQDYLVDRKIDEPWRDQIPMLCRGQEVLLIAGVGAGNIPRWNPEEKQLRLQWKGRMPWKE